MNTGNVITTKKLLSSTQRRLLTKLD